MHLYSATHRATPIRGDHIVRGDNKNIRLSFSTRRTQRSCWLEEISASDRSKLVPIKPKHEMWSWRSSPARQRARGVGNWLQLHSSKRHKRRKDASPYPRLSSHSEAAVRLRVSSSSSPESRRWGSTAGSLQSPLLTFNIVFILTFYSICLILIFKNRHNDKQSYYNKNTT